MFKLLLTITLIILGIFQSNFGVTTYPPPPPNTTLIKEIGYWVDKEEIKIADWQEFFTYIKNAYGLDTANTLVPDTCLIIQQYNLKSYSNLKLKEKYKLPIIGLTYHQIMQYCTFRSEVVNIKYKTSYEFAPLKLEVLHYLNFQEKKLKNLKPIGSNVPEIVVISDDSIKIVNQTQGNINRDKGLIFGFRCIVKAV